MSLLKIQQQEEKIKFYNQVLSSLVISEQSKKDAFNWATDLNGKVPENLMC